MEIPVTNCAALVQPHLERRPGNALNVEVGQPAPRCLLKTEWSDRISGYRWLASGGSLLVFGPCDIANCPKSSGFHDE